MSRIEFPQRQAFSFSLQKQHVLPDCGGHSVERIADTLVGIHAARLITPFFAVRARKPGFQHRDLDIALHSTFTLVKARCMRGTLHLLTRELFHIAHHATLDVRLGVCRSLYRRLRLQRAAIERIKVRVLRAVEKGAKSTHEIQRVVARDAEPAAIRAVIKELWESGRLWYSNRGADFGTENRLYGPLPSAFSVSVNEADVAECKRKLIYRYLQGYGPATIGDAVWWSGLDATSVRQAFNDLSQDVAEVAIRGFPERFWVLAKDLDALTAHRSPRTEWATFLAHEDPSLKGYYETRARYIAREHYRRLFNDIGESRPAILLNGTVVGTWSLDRKANTASASLFAPLRKKQETLIRKQLDEIRESVTALYSPGSPSKDRAS